MKNKKSGFWFQLGRDKWLILLCFVLAFLAWQAIRKDQGFTLTVSNIAVEVEAPEGWAVWEKSDDEVNIHFRGSREDIRYLNSDQLKVIIPIPDPEHGEAMTLKLSNQFLKNPTDAKVVSFSPAEIQIRLDEESEKVLPVKAALEDTLPEGMEIDRIVCTPATVRVSGARQVLEEMETIHTEAISLKDRQMTFKETISIAMPHAGRMTAEPNRVAVEVFLEERNSSTTYENIPVRVLSAPEERRIILVAPKTISVTVSGQQQRMEQVRAADIFAFVNCYDLTESTGYELPIVVDLPAGLKLIKTEPSVVEVEISSEN